MRGGLVFWLALLAALVPRSAGAAERTPDRRWEIDVRAAYVVLGDAVLTGGLMPVVAARHAWALGRADVFVGAELGAFGLGDGTHLVGVLGGPTVGGSLRPWGGAVATGLEVAAGIGRIPVCNNWGLCVRHVGLFPAATITGAWYAGKLAAVGAFLTVRYVNTLAWEGASWEPGARGIVFW